MIPLVKSKDVADGILYRADVATLFETILSDHQGLVQVAECFPWYRGLLVEN